MNLFLLNIYIPSYLRSYFWYSILFCCGFQAVAVGQPATAIPYFAPGDSVRHVQLAREIAESVHTHFQPPAHFAKAAKEDYLKSREKLEQDVSGDIARTVITDPVLWPYLQKVHTKIVEANPTMKNTRVLLLADPMPNAYSIGEGTFVVHVGLLAGLENEDQLAFVLCHEMAHYALAHAVKGLEARIEERNSKAFKEKMKKLQQEEYNRSEKVEALLNNMLFNNRYHSRHHELQSDSLAYQYIVRTAYQARQSGRLMEVFGDIDEPFRDTQLEFGVRFGCPQQPFRDSWLFNSSGSVWDDTHKAQAEANKVYRDSLSTHPDWEKRLKCLKSLMEKVPPGTSTNMPVTAEYVPIRYQAAIECVEAWASYERYDRALYLALHYQRLYPECQYFKEVETLALCQFYQYAKNHNLAEVLAQSSLKYPDQYNQYLDFLNNLRVKELLGLAECSLVRLPEEKGEHGLLAAWQLALAKGDKTIAGNIKKSYTSRFPEGRFAARFKQ